MNSVCNKFRCQRRELIATMCIHKKKRGKLFVISAPSGGGKTSLTNEIINILEKDILDQTLVVRNEDAKNMADRLCREEGLFCGMSSGANVYAAIQMAKKMKSGSKIVTVLVDRRDRYFAEYPHEQYIV